MSTASTDVPAQPGADIFVFALREKGERPAVVIISPSAPVALLAEFVRDKLDLKVPTDCVVLKSVDNVLLDSYATLAAAGIKGGSTVIATLVAPPQPATTGSGGK
jgi:hypothetical protein